MLLTTQIDPVALIPFARKYVWWKTAEKAVMMPERVIAQVMDIGDYDDVQALVKQVGNDSLRAVIYHAQAGQFSPRSWAYWHYRLGLATLDSLPEMPKRSLA